MRKKYRFSVMLCACTACVAALWVYVGSFRTVVTMGREGIPAALGRRLILDAGHGGFDGGATGVNGTVEKDVNLAITQKTASIARLAGFSVSTVRNTDEAVQDKDARTIREKKVSDIHNRLKMAQQYADGIFVSIHQNSFPQEYCNGTQVFYSKNDPRSEKLALYLQKGIAGRLQPENKREIKPAEKNLYILYHAQNPALLVECGFLSNKAECEKLCDPAYQQQLAFCIVCSLAEGIRQ